MILDRRAFRRWAAGLLTVADVAAGLGVPPETVRRWVAEGKLLAVDLREFRGYSRAWRDEVRFFPDAVRRFAEETGDVS